MMPVNMGNEKPVIRVFKAAPVVFKIRQCGVQIARKRIALNLMEFKQPVESGSECAASASAAIS